MVGGGRAGPRGGGDGSGRKRRGAAQVGRGRGRGVSVRGPGRRVARRRLPLSPGQPRGAGRGPERGAGCPEGPWGLLVEPLKPPGRGPGQPAPGVPPGAGAGAGAGGLLGACQPQPLRPCVVCYSETLQSPRKWQGLTCR